MYKIMTIVGTRPELIKMSKVISEFDILTNHVLVHTGQNYDYELNQVFFEDLQIRKPDYFLNSGGKNSVDAIGNIIKLSDEVIKEKLDGILLYGDTNSCLSVILLKKQNSCFSHGGQVIGVLMKEFQEEINRKIVDHLSDINLVLTEHARRYLIREGISQDKIFKTGSHMLEVLNFYKNNILKSEVLKNLKLNKKQYFVVSMHRENVDSENLNEIVNSLIEIEKKYNIPIIVSTHPRTL